MDEKIKLLRELHTERGQRIDLPVDQLRLWRRVLKPGDLLVGEWTFISIPYLMDVIKAELAAGVTEDELAQRIKGARPDGN